MFLPDFKYPPGVRLLWRIFCLGLLAFGPTTAISAAGDDATTVTPEIAAADQVVFENLTVIGGEDNLENLPGSAHLLSAEELETHNYRNIHRVLAQVPGVNIQEEDGWGRRPNIGMRGTGSERSSKITVLEDGILIAPAPYAAPAAYYFPVAGRMESIEVRKGSSSIRQGPYTNGGVLNLLSTSIPGQFSGRLEATGGQHDSARVRGLIGSSHKRWGWMAETYQLQTDGFKELDGGGNTGFDLGDYVVKFRVNSDSDAKRFQTLEVKLGYTEELSHETYLGLTDDDFKARPWRRYAASQADTLDTDHGQIQLRYMVMPLSGIEVTATAYRNEFFRNWHKLQSVRGVGIADLLENPDVYAQEMELVRSEADSEPGDLKLRNNRRNYYSQGVEMVLSVLRFDRHDLDIGVRYHEDQEDRFQEEDFYQMLGGQMELNGLGTPGSQSNRLDDAEALALFVQDQIVLDRWTITPGLRFESIDYLRSDYGKTDPDRTGENLVSKPSSIDVWIPGVGVDYRLQSKTSLFAGIHKGFSPPGPGRDDETRPEESVNFELGWRYFGQITRVDIVAFFNDYENLLGHDTLSSGGTGEDDMFNGGEATVRGLEVGFSTDPGLQHGWKFHTPLRLAYTYTYGRFDNSFESDYGPWEPFVIAGDEMPYLPPHQLFADFGVGSGKWNAHLGLNYMSEMRTSAGSGPIPSDEATDARVVLDLSGEIGIPGGLRLFGQIRNLTDEVYIAARRPAGVRPGLTRTAMLGVRWDF